MGFWDSALTFKTPKFGQYMDNAPKFSGDILFHERINGLIIACHEARVHGDIRAYHSCVYGLYAETRSWFSTDGIEEKVVAELDNVAQNIQVMFQNNQRDTFVDFEILQRLNKVFRIIIQECHISELMLKIDKPKGNMLDAD